MEISTRTQPPFVVVAVSGEVDVSTAGTMRLALREIMVPGSVHVLLDLAAVTFMDSAGLGALVATQKAARAFRGSFALVAPSKQVMRILSLTSLDKVLRHHPSIEAAGIPMGPELVLPSAAEQ